MRKQFLVALACSMLALGAKAQTVKEYFQVGGTCYEATHLSDKSTIHVQSTANGYIPQSAVSDTFTCGSNPNQTPSQSVFLEFTPSEEAFLEFTISPDRGAEFDWILYELYGCHPNTKFIPGRIKCNFFDNVGPHFFGLETGMSSDSTRSAEYDNFPFLYPHKLKKAQKYLLVISNRNRDGDGFTLSFGGNFTMDYAFDFPTGFSPNGDGVNDLFGGYGKGIDVYSYHLTIYDRFGSLIFESYDPEEHWNGNVGNDTNYPVQPGVFVYELKYNDNNGNPYVKRGVAALTK